MEPASSEDFGKENAALRAYIAELERRLTERDALIKKLQERIEGLESKLAEHSGNSHRPPSSDKPWKKRKRKSKSSGKKRGGQVGHKGSFRKLLPAEQMDEVIMLWPALCKHCDAGLAQRPSATPWRHQQVDMDERMRLVRTEYQLQQVSCPRCARSTRATLAAEQRSVFGPSLQAMISVLRSRYRQSERQVQSMLWEFWHCRISKGSMERILRRTAQALEPAASEAIEAIQQAPLSGMDETSFRHLYELYWLWVRQNDELSVYHIDKHRSRQASETLLPELEQGAILISDDYSAYRHLPQEQRQLCFAHLLRELERCAEHADNAVRFVAAKLLACAGRLFQALSRVRDGTLGLAEFAQQIRCIQKSMKGYCALGATLRPKKTAGFFARLAAKLPMYFTFAKDPLRIAPTNNASEQALRHAVIWRKLSFGTRDEWGKLFVQHMLTVMESLKKQKRSLFAFIKQALLAQLGKALIPSILPA